MQMFEPFQQFIAKASHKYGINKEMQAAKVCHDFRELVPSLFEGKENPEKYVQPAHFKNNILVINAENPAWSQEIIMRKEKIIREMNAKLGIEIIKNLRTQLKRN